MTSTENNGNKVSIPLTVFITAFSVLACYTAKLNTDIVTIQKDTIKLMTAQQIIINKEFNRVHFEHQQVLDTQKILSAEAKINHPKPNIP